MANSATAGTALKIGVVSATDGGAITPVTVSIDTIDEDLIILSPGTAQHAAIHGIVLCDDAAAKVTIKSGSDILAELNLSANTPVMLPIARNPLVVTAIGEDLIIQSTVAIDSILLYVSQFSYLALE